MIDNIDLTRAEYWLPLAFIFLMGLAIIIYAILDGYDLGVGILLPLDSDAESDRDTMIASIGPFWDANETWLVLAVGLLLIAFPAAHGIIMGEFYLPVTLLLIALILRGVAFDFRAKAPTNNKFAWDKAFKAGSILAALSQGYMLGKYVVGFDSSLSATVFCLLSALGVTVAYAFIGGAWLVMKTEGELQKKIAWWTRRAAWLTAFGCLLVSTVNPLMNDAIFKKWFALPQLILMLPYPLVCLGLFVINDRYLKSMPHHRDFGCWIPFVTAASIFFMLSQGLAYSFFPFIVPEQLTIWEAAAATESLMFIFIGTMIVVPAILAYTLFSYRVFWGKATELKYY